MSSIVKTRPSQHTFSPFSLLYKYFLFVLHTFITQKVFEKTVIQKLRVERDHCTLFFTQRWTETVRVCAVQLHCPRACKSVSLFITSYVRKGLSPKHLVNQQLFDTFKCHLSLLLNLTVLTVSRIL